MPQADPANRRLLISDGAVAIHIQNVNSWHSRVNWWLAQFCYAGWRCTLGARRLTTPAHLLCAAAQLG